MLRKEKKGVQLRTDGHYGGEEAGNTEEEGGEGDGSEQWEEA